MEKGDRAEGIHASDLLNPLQSYWKRIDPRPLSDRQVTTFLVGKVLHAFILGSPEGPYSLPNIEETDGGSKWSEELKLWYSLDAATPDGAPAEFKSSRALREPKDVKDVDSYVQQTLIYMASTDKCTAELWILLMNLKEGGRTHPSFRAYTITISTGDMVQLKQAVADRVQLLTTALEQKDPSQLPLCASFICGAKNCPWWAECKPKGRYGDSVDASETKDTPQ